MDSVGRTAGEAQRPNLWSKLLFSLGIVVGAVLLGGFLFLPIIVAAYNSPSGSMVPTLHVGDHFFVVKRFDHEALPQRGDVVVFKMPSTGSDSIKRVIGLPGDTIQMRAGLLYINGTAVRRESAGDFVGANGTTLMRYHEFLPDGRTHDIVEGGDQGSLDNTSVFAVPPGHLFMIGDNRDNSADSRVADIGFIPVENVIGRASFIYWSNDLGRLFMGID